MKWETNWRLGEVRQPARVEWVGWVLCILQGETGWYYIWVLISQPEHIPHIMAWGGIDWRWTGGVGVGEEEGQPRKGRGG